MAGNVQFTNKDDVIEAYKRMHVGPWAIWCGKELNFSCALDKFTECEAELIEYLDMLDRSEIPVYYALRVYDDVDGKITSKTPYTSSFNFRLTESANGIKRLGASDGLGGMTIGGLKKQWEAERALLDEVKAMRMELQELKEGGGEDEELDDYGMGKIGKILQHPQVGPIVNNLVAGIMGWLNNNRPGAAAAAAAGNRVISGVPGDQQPDPLEVLTAAYPDFPDLLGKLARMLQKDPGQLNFLVTTLRGMNV